MVMLRPPLDNTEGRGPISTGPPSAEIKICFFSSCWKIITLWRWSARTDCEQWGKDFLGGSVVKNLPAMQEPQEMWVQSLGWEDSPEMGMATHSRILAWRIPRTDQPSRLQCMGTRRVGHDSMHTVRKDGTGDFTPSPCPCFPSHPSMPLLHYCECNPRKTPTSLQHWPVHCSTSASLHMVSFSVWSGWLG